jgi:glycerophosphoryl diester phosphodiesterase
MTPTITIGGKTAILTCHVATLSRQFRPNSRAAIRECLDGGVARIEIDVHSLDGPDYIVTHDRRLERSTTGSGSVGLATPDVVRAVSFLDDPNDRPALLSEVVDMARGTNTQLQLDLKDWRLLREPRLRTLLDLVAPIRSQIIVSAGEDWNLRQVHAADPALPIGFDPGRYIAFGSDEPPFLPKALGAYGYRDDHPLAVGRTEEPAFYLQQRMELFVLQVPASCELFLDHRLILQMLDDGFNPADWLHQHHSELTAWTVDYTGADSMRTVERLIAAGVDRITTNTPLAWVEAFATNGSPS